MPTVSSNGIEMHYEIHGEGKPLICIMGITAPGEVWEEHVKVWSQHYQCITPDNRGVGLSDKPEGEYSSAMMADDYAGLMDALGIEKASVVGCSMGSIIAQELALRHPEKVEKLVLMCSWARCDAYAKSIFSHLEVLKEKVSAAEFMEYIQLLIFHKRSWDDDETLQSLVKGRQEALEDENPQPLHGLRGQAAACVNHNTIEQLVDIKAACLVIGGEADCFTPRWMADEIHAALPNSNLHLYPESGHAFHWENLTDFNQRVLDFVGA